MSEQFGTEHHEPYLDLLLAIFADHTRTERSVPPMTQRERIEWMKENMPKTYAMVIQGKIEWAKAFRD
jgi:hypothetical protein